METGSWDVFKTILNWVVYPLLCFLGWYIKDQSYSVKLMKDDISQLKLQQAVTDSQIKDIRNDIKDLSLVVREAEKSILTELRQVAQNGK